MRRLDSLQIGESIEEVQLDAVTKQDLINYSNASGDYNPIHTSEQEAMKTGLPGIIAHGMLTMGKLGTLFSRYYEEGYVQDYSIKFKGMVFLEDVLTLRADLKEKHDHTMIFNVSAVNQDEKEVVKGNVLFRRFN